MYRFGLLHASAWRRLGAAAALCLALGANLVQPAPPALAQAVPGAAGSVLFADGDLLQVRGDDKLYVVQGGARRWIADTQSLAALNLDFRRLKQVSFEQLDALPAGRPHRQLPLIREPATGRVYLLTWQTNEPAPAKHWINDLESFTRLGFAWSDVALDWATPPDRYRDAPALTYRPLGTLPVTWLRDGEALTVVPAWRAQTEDERLYHALALSHTYNRAWREQVGPKLAPAGVWIEWGDLPELVGGRYHTRLNRITLNRSLQQESPGVIAAVLSHEVMHAVTARGAADPQGCIAEEVAAFGVGAVTWAGLPAKWRSASEWGRSLDGLVNAWRLGLIARFVSTEPAYLQQCRVMG
jgi:hypothetical protein